jgi:HK97 family phage major capsid protein
MNTFLKKLSLIAQAIAAVTFVACYNLLRIGGLNTVKLRFAVVEEKSTDKLILESLSGLNERLKKIEEIEKAVGKNREDYDAITKLVAEVKIELDTARKAQLGIKRNSIRRHGEYVSNECAAHLGGILLAAGISQGRFSGRELEMAESQVKNLFGIHAKAALTSSDIPLPTEYSGDIVELVYQYGQGRQLATVFPMGALTVKLPKLTTDPTFTLIAGSGTVTEKSPQFAFVTLTAEKFGGLVRMPSEIDEDSIVAMGQFLARYAARGIARAEDTQVFTSTGGGSGVNGTGPGLLAAAVTDSCDYSLGGTTSGGKTAISQAVIADFRNLRSTSTLSGIVLKNAKYYMHPTFEALLVSFNTSATVQPYQRATAGSPATFDGFPIEWVSVMPVFTSSASVSTAYVLFGDASYQYLGIRNGIRFDTSKEAGFTTDEILVRALERMTVGLMASKAVAALITDAS